MARRNVLISRRTLYRNIQSEGWSANKQTDALSLLIQSDLGIMMQRLNMGLVPRIRVAVSRASVHN
jgi:hypothetical protein